MGGRREGPQEPHRTMQNAQKPKKKKKQQMYLWDI